MTISANRFSAFRAALLGGVLALGVHNAMAQGVPYEFLTYPEPEGYGGSSFTGVSDDGLTVAGTFFAGDMTEDTAVRWHRASGIEMLSDPFAEFSEYLYINGISGDGRTVFGGGLVPDTFGAGYAPYTALRWTEDGGWESLGYLYEIAPDDDAPDLYSGAYGANYDGSLIVGDSVNQDHWTEAFVWSEETGMMTGLGAVDNGEDRSPFSAATDLTDDGSVIVGQSNSGYFSFPGHGYVEIAAVYWTAPGEIHQLPLLVSKDDYDEGTHYIYGQANAITPDGNTIVGSSSGEVTEEPDENGVLRHYSQAVRWNLGEGGYSVEALPVDNFAHTLSTANNISRDGSTIVGRAIGMVGEVAAHMAAVWTDAGGGQSIFDWLADRGVETDPSAYIFSNAFGVNADGSVIAGIAWVADEEAPLGFNGAGFIATPQGMIMPQPVMLDMNRIAAAFNSMELGNLLQQGAHGHPLDRRVAAGQTQVWAAGDWGRNDHDYRDGTIGVAEVGVAHHTGDMQVNVSIGKNWSDQNLAFSGSVDAESLFINGEAIIPVEGHENLFVVLGAYRQWGDIDTVRNYLNAGIVNSSRASPDVEGWGARARLEAVDAYVDGETRFSPYVDLSYERTRIEGFTETGGGFPATFAPRTDKQTEARLGVSAVTPFDAEAGIDLTFGGEVAYRFEDDGATTSGTIGGAPIAFSFQNNHIQQTWVKGSVGLQGMLNGGMARLRVNLTSEGSMPNAWAAASYQIGF